MERGTRVYVGGLSENIKKEDLELEFEKFGKLNSVWVAFNPPGFAFVEFSSQDDAEAACDNMNDAEVMGSRLRVEISRGRGRGRGGGGRGGRFDSRGGRGGYRGGGGGGYRGDDDRGGDRFGGGRGGGGFRVSKVVEPYEEYRDRDLEQTQFTSYDFKVLTLLILNELAASSSLPSDLPISSIPSHPLLHILKFSLDYLSTLQLSTHPSMDRTLILRIRQLLIRLVHTCVIKIRHSREFAKYIIQYHGILSTLIKIVEDVVSKMDNETLRTTAGKRTETSPLHGQTIRTGEEKLIETLDKLDKETMNSLGAAGNGGEPVDERHEGETNGREPEKTEQPPDGEEKRGNREEDEGRGDSVNTGGSAQTGSGNNKGIGNEEITKRIFETNMKLLDSSVKGSGETRYLFNLTFTVFLLYKHIIKYYNMNEEKFNIFLQLLNNFVNNKNINTIIKESANEDGQVIHELLLIKIVRLMDNKHRVVLFNMLNELITSIQSVKSKLTSNDGRKLNNVAEINNETNSYHHVHILGHSYSVLNNNKCIISNLNWIMISFLNCNPRGVSCNHLGVSNRDNNPLGVSCNPPGVSNRDKLEKVPNCDRASEVSGAIQESSPRKPNIKRVEQIKTNNNGCCTSSKDLDSNALNVHIVKLLLNNGACCCFPHKILLHKIHSLLVLSEGNKKMVTHCFMLLENMLYRELNYYSGALPCKYCDLVFVENNSNMLESNTSPSKQEKNNSESKHNASKNIPNGDATKGKPTSSKFTITNILSKTSSNRNSTDKKQSKNTNVTSTTSGNNTSSTCNEDKAIAHAQDKAKPSPDGVAKQCSSIDEELLISFYKSIIQGDQYKLKCKLLAHLIRVVNMFKSNVQLELVEQIIHPLFVKLKNQILRSKFVPKEFRVLSEKPGKNEEDLNEFIIVDKDLNIISSDKLDASNQIEQTTPTNTETTPTPIKQELIETPIDSQCQPSASHNEEATSDVTQPGKKVIKRRRSRKNSSEHNKQNNVPPQRPNDSKKKLTPKNSKDKLTPSQSKPGGDESSKPNSPNEKHIVTNDERLESELKQIDCAKTCEESPDKLRKNLNSNQDKDVYKASIDQTLESFEQTKNAALITETSLKNSALVAETSAKSEPNQNVNETKVDNTESVTDDAKSYEQNSNLMIQVLIIVQNLTKQNKHVAKLLKKFNVHESLNEILLVENLTKLVCNILENLLVASYDKKSPTTVLGYAEGFNLLMDTVRHIGVKLLTIINSTDDNLMNTIIFQTKLDQDVYLYCITVLNALVKSVDNVLERFSSLATIETIRFLGDLYDSINSVIVRYVFVEEFPQYKDSNHKSLELKLLETFIVFKTLCQVKKLSDLASNSGSDAATTEQGESKQGDSVKENNVSAKDTQGQQDTKADQSRLKRTLVTGINRRHFNLKQVWDMLIKCSIQSVSVQHSSVKLNTLYQQYPTTVLAYSTDCESMGSNASSTSTDSSTSSKSSPDNPSPSHPLHNTSNDSSSKLNKCIIRYPSHFITALDIVLHYIVTNGRKTSMRDTERRVNTNENSEPSKTEQYNEDKEDNVASGSAAPSSPTPSQMSSSVVSSHQVSALPHSCLVSEHELLYCLQNVISIVKNSRDNCLTLLSRDIVMKLLKYYFDFGSRNVRALILNIVVQVGVYDLRARELLYLIGLFKTEASAHAVAQKKLGPDPSPPSSTPSSLYILDTLQALVSQHKPYPDFVLKLHPPLSRVYKPARLDLEPLSNKLSYSMMQSYDKNGMVSPWNSSAVCIPITCDLGWALWVQGISISLWYLLEGDSPSPSAPRPYHLLSIGYEGFLIEFYADQWDLLIRLTRPERNSYELLNETVVPKCVRYGEYDQLCISIKDTLQSKSKRVVINVDLVMNDNCQYSAALLFQGILIRKSRPMCILLGDKLSPCPSLSLTHLLAFRTPCLNQLLLCMLLHALGPSPSNLTECEVGNVEPDLTRLVRYCTENKLTYASYELLISKRVSLMRRLQEHLLLIYSARTPESVALYPPALTTSTVGLLPSQPHGFFKAHSQDSRPSQRFPIIKGVNIYCEQIGSESCAGLSTAIQDVAGVHCFLFLFARVVEIEASAEDQAKALDIVLKVADLLAQSVDYSELYALIVQVLCTPRCKPSISMLKVLFNNMCGGTCDILTQSRESLAASSTLHSGVGSNNTSSSGGLLGGTHLQCLIQKPHVLTDVLLESWKYWSRDCLSLLFSTVYSLIKDEHPYREFNTMQLNRVNLLDRILLVCKQMYLYDDNADHQYLLSGSCCQTIVEIFRALMGTPPPLEYIDLLVTYLLISHPTSDAFICHSRSSFYFLHSSIPSQLSEGDVAAAPSGTDSNYRKFSTWHGRDLARPVDPDYLSTALRDVQTTQRYYGNYAEDEDQEKRGGGGGAGGGSSEFDRSTTNIDSGISGSLRENTSNSVENNSQVRSSLGLFPEPPRSSSFSGRGGLFSSFRRNSLSQHYENLFFKKSSMGFRQQPPSSSYASSRLLSERYGMGGLDSEDTVEEPVDCLSAGGDGSLERRSDSQLRQENDDNSNPSSPEKKKKNDSSPTKDNSSVETGFNLGKPDESPSLDLKLFDFINKCRTYALSAGGSDKRSPDKEEAKKELWQPVSVGELEDSEEHERQKEQEGKDDTQEDGITKPCEENDAHEDIVDKSANEETKVPPPKQENILSERSLEIQRGRVSPEEAASSSGKQSSKGPNSGQSSPLGRIPTPVDQVDHCGPHEASTGSDKEVVQSVLDNGSGKSKSSSAGRKLDGLLSERSLEIERGGDLGNEPARNVINLSENLTQNEHIRKLLSELDGATQDIHRFGRGYEIDGLSEHKRRSLIEIAFNKHDQHGVDIRETRSMDTGRSVPSDRRGSEGIEEVKEETVVNMGDKEEMGDKETEEDLKTSGESVEKNDGSKRGSKEYENPTDVMITYAECNEEDVETSSLSGHEMLAQQNEKSSPQRAVLPTASYDPQGAVLPTVSYDTVGTMEQLFEAASRTNILFNNSNLLQSKQEILLSALSISDIGADSDNEDDLESNLDDMEKILDEGSETPPVDSKPQCILNDGLIILLRDIILVLPDNMIGAVFNKIITLDILLILANHKDVRIRISLMKLIYSYLQRSSEDDLAEFMYKNRGFYLLSNQISLYPPSMDLANSCVMFLTDCHWLPIQEQLNYIEQINLSPKQMCALPLILSLLNISISKFHLCLQLLRFIEKLVKKMSTHNLNKVVNDYGLVQCLLKVAIKIAHDMKNSEKNSVTAYDVLLDSIDAILITIVTRILTSDVNVSNNTQMFNNIILYMMYIENIEVTTCGAGSKCYITLKNIHRTLLEYALDVVQDTITKQMYVTHQSVTNKIKRSLLSVLPSSHSSTTYELDHDELSDSSSVHSYPAPYDTGHLRIRNNLESGGHPAPVSGDSSSPQYERGDTSDARQGEAYSVQSGVSRSMDSTMYNKRVNMKKYDKEKPVSTGKMMQKSELIERYKTVISKCVDYIIYSDPIYPMTVSETNFICHMLVTMLLSINSVIEKKNNTNYSSIMWTIRHSLRTKTSQLIIWILEPSRQCNLRIFLVNTLRNEIYLKEILTNLFVNNNLEIKFILFLWELIYCCKLNNDDLRICYEFESKLRSIINHDIGNANSRLNREVFTACKEFKTSQNEWILSQMQHINKMILNRYEQLVKQITDTSIASTQECLLRQNDIQKTLLTQIKAIYNKQLSTTEVWSQLIANLTHEKAPWYCEESYPKSWQLDDVEGPERIRIRQKRCHLYLDEKYLKPEYRTKTAAYKRESPLEYLVKDSIKHESMIETIQTNEQVTYMCCSHLITPSKQIQGELLITSGGLKFIPFNESHTFVTKAVNSERNLADCEKTKDKSQGKRTVYRTEDIISVQFTNIKEIHNRRYNLQEKAIELFLINGKNYLFAFENHNDREHFLNELSTCHLPNRMTSDLLTDTIQVWREGHLTNWAYLMILNKMSGRSYNDLMQYPVLPFILSDYKSPTLDLTDPKSFRNLKKPISVQDKKSEAHYLNTYTDLERAMCDAVGGVNQEPYHYGSHYSNSGTVLHFMVRIPPYTSMFLSYQDNNFDLPDRTFHNLDTTWRLTSAESTTDVKELIPELFYLADLLVNNEGFDFGVRQNGQRVDSVMLPPWAPDPRTFIMVHRQSLESEIVSENLPHWIDLVFGYKQSGKAAVDAINVFHPATYYGFDIAAIPDPMERIAWETMLRTYGQTPRQLFKSTHPMNVKKLTPAHESRIEVIPNIRGLVWGSYVGSPDEPPPCIVWKHKHRNPVSKLVPLKTNDVFGLAKFTTLLHSYHKDKNTNLISSLNVIGAGMICWNECDNLIRLKMSKELPATPVIRPPLGATIATATTAPDCHTLWLGLTNGNILVYEYELNANSNKIEFTKPPTTLLGHSKQVTDLYLCANFSVAVSSSEDGTCLLWDINTIGYIREIPCVDPNTPVSHITMSETNGELASVLQSTGGSILRLHTINAQLITSLASDVRITSVTFSNAPEGVSQNVVVTGHVDGSIQLWSGYKLAHLLTLHTNVPLPVIAVTYSCDSQHLYASNTEGLVIIWESSSHNRTPKFLNLTLV
uniref:Lysosomal-trafficking regulator n=1 Tax=Cacopsylla melanoneura TaxID=428564 RepID=A0A8D8QMF4_9HEMI